MAEPYTNEHVELPEDFEVLIAFMSEDELVQLMTFLSFHHDLCLRVYERRFGVELDPSTGAPCIPYDGLPDGFEMPETILTRGAGPP